MPVISRTVSTARPLPDVTPAHRWLALLLVAAAVLAVAAAVAAGWWTGGRVTAEPEPAPLTKTTVGPVEAAVAGDWRPVGAGAAGALQPDTGAGTLVQDVVASSGETARFARGAAAAVVTFTETADASLLPPWLRAAVTAPPPAPVNTILLGVPAWRYAELELSGRRLAEVTVVPTTGGVLGVACIAGEDHWSEAIGCTSGLRSLSLQRGDWLTPSAQLAAAERLAPALARLDRERVAGRAALAAAPTRRGQARAARRVQAAFGRAVAELQPVAARAGASSELVGALRRARQAYAGLAVAARRGESRRYAGARWAVTEAELAARRSAAELAGTAGVR